MTREEAAQNIKRFSDTLDMLSESLLIESMHMAIEALSNNNIESPMGDSISRQAVIDAAECIVDHHSITPYKTMRSAVDHLKRIIVGLPSVDRTGHWKIYNHVDRVGRLTATKICVCDQCEETMSLPWRAKIPNYCQNCGADMRNAPDTLDALEGGDDE